MHHVSTWNNAIGYFVYIPSYQCRKTSTCRIPNLPNRYQSRWLPNLHICELRIFLFSRAICLHRGIPLVPPARPLTRCRLTARLRRTSVISEIFQNGRQVDLYLVDLRIMCFRVFCLLRAFWWARSASSLIRHGLQALLHPVIGGVHETQKSAFSDFTPKLSLFPHISVNCSPPSKAVATNSGTQRAWGALGCWWSWLGSAISGSQNLGGWTNMESQLVKIFIFDQNWEFRKTLFSFSYNGP